MTRQNSWPKFFLSFKLGKVWSNIYLDVISTEYDIYQQISYVYVDIHSTLGSVNSPSAIHFPPIVCFEGTLRAGLQLHDTHKDAGVEHGRVVHLERIFLLMGRFLQEVTCWVVAFLRDFKRTYGQLNWFELFQIT